MNPTKISATAESLLKSWEGFSLTAYADSAGVPTIGWGHTHGVQMGQTVTTEQAEEFFLADIAPSEACVTTACKVDLAQNQYDALVIFVFNVGEGAFYNSTLLKTINQGNLSAVPELMAQWRYITDPKTGKKVVSNGLVNRRAKEIALWAASPTPEGVGASSQLVMIPSTNVIPADVGHLAFDAQVQVADVPVPIAPPAKVNQTRVGQSTLTAIFTGLSGAVIEGFQQAQSLVAGLHSAFDGTATSGQLVKLLATALAVASIVAAVVAWYWKRKNMNGGTN